MIKSFRRIGILTSGGDAPGMNAAIRSVTRTAIARGVEVMGIYRGYRGLIEGDMKLFSIRDVSNIVNHGGTILFSDRCAEFKTEEGMQKAINMCRNNKIDGIVAIGGDGTFRGATDMTVRGIPCIGIPATIDNDIASTDSSIGFDTAMNTVVQMVDRLRDTCESHARCSVVEVMGRNAGDLALQTGIATGASAIAISEIPFDEKEAIENIKKSKQSGKRNFIVIVSEGLGKCGEDLSVRIEQQTGIETRFARLAHVVRGGSPSLRDRLLATKMGAAAVEELLAGKSNIVIRESCGDITTMDIGLAFTLDRYYKGVLKDGELDKYTPDERKMLDTLRNNKRQSIEKLYMLSKEISQ